MRRRAEHWRGEEAAQGQVQAHRQERRRQHQDGLLLHVERQRMQLHQGLHAQVRGAGMLLAPNIDSLTLSVSNSPPLPLSR